MILRRLRPRLQIPSQVIHLPKNLPLGFCSFDFVFAYSLDFSPFFVPQIHPPLSRWRPKPLMERPALMNPPAKRLPRLPPQKPARDPVVVLMALRPQERQALHRPPILPPPPFAIAIATDLPSPPRHTRKLRPLAQDYAL